MPLVEFREAFQIHRGPLFNAGERAMLSEEDSREAQQQRCGILVQDASGYDYDGRKALSNPPAHKQIKTPLGTK